MHAAGSDPGQVFACGIARGSWRVLSFPLAKTRLLIRGNEWKIDGGNRHSAAPRLGAEARSKGFLHAAEAHVERIRRELLQQRITSRAARFDPLAGDQRPIAGGGLVDSRGQS